MSKQRVGAGVGVMLKRDGKVLLGRRYDDPDKADSMLHGEGTWTFPGGKLDFGETILGYIKREVEEETGIIVKNANVFCVNNDRVHDAHFVTIGLYSEDFEGDPEVREPDEITKWKWFLLDELPKNLYFPTARMIENYTHGVFFEER